MPLFYFTKMIVSDMAHAGEESEVIQNFSCWWKEGKKKEVNVENRNNQQGSGERRGGDYGKCSITFKLPLAN